MKCLTEKKIYMVDSMRGATFEKWAKLSVFLIKKLLFMKEFLHFEGLGDLWEVKNFTKKPVFGQVDMYQENSKGNKIFLQKNEDSVQG